MSSSLTTLKNTLTPYIAPLISTPRRRRILIVTTALTVSIGSYYYYFSPNPTSEPTDTLTTTPNKSQSQPQSQQKESEDDKVSNTYNRPYSHVKTVNLQNITVNALLPLILKSILTGSGRSCFISISDEDGDSDGDSEREWSADLVTDIVKQLRVHRLKSSTSPPTSTTTATAASTTAPSENESWRNLRDVVLTRYYTSVLVLPVLDCLCMVLLVLLPHPSLVNDDDDGSVDNAGDSSSVDNVSDGSSGESGKLNAIVIRSLINYVTTVFIPMVDAIVHDSLLKASKTSTTNDDDNDGEGEWNMQSTQQALSSATFKDFSKTIINNIEIKHGNKSISEIIIDSIMDHDFTTFTQTTNTDVSLNANIAAKVSELFNTTKDILESPIGLNTLSTVLTRSFDNFRGCVDDEIFCVNAATTATADGTDDNDGESEDVSGKALTVPVFITSLKTLCNRQFFSTQGGDDGSSGDYEYKMFRYGLLSAYNTSSTSTSSESNVEGGDGGDERKYGVERMKEIREVARGLRL